MSLSFIKLDINIMNDSKIKQIRKMPAGNDMIVLWIGLLCLGMRSGRSGIVELGDNIPYDSDMLSVEFDIEKRTVELALTIFQKFNMIEVFENGSILLCNFEKHQELEKIEKAKESQRERTRKFRENKRQKLLPPSKNTDLSVDVTVTSQLPNGDTTKCNDTDIDVDTDKKKKNTKNKDNNVCSEENINEIYKAYPRKVGKPRALKSIRKALAVISFEKLLPIVVLYAKYRKNEEPKYTPHPTTWFNNEMWNDIEDSKPSNNSNKNGSYGKTNTLSDPEAKVNQLRDDYGF